jgi:polyphosphate kinase
MVFRAILTAAALVLGSPALAHPHLFIDTGVEVLFDPDGTAGGVRITWTYDEMYSLLILEDRGLDKDYDGVLTDAELAVLNGFDMDWDPGYAGDTYALLGEAPMDLGRPQDWTVALRDGKIVSSHVRRLAGPAAVSQVPLIVQSYDPSFYAAYRIVGTPVVSGRTGCTAQVFEPDLAAADDFLQQALAELNATGDVEGEFPAVGAAYADEVRVTCDAPS